MPRLPLALALMLLSGAAALGYQIVWTQQAAAWLGHDSAAVLAVVAAFFGGLALGALALGPRIERSPRPARWYAGCEAVVALWALGLALALQPASQWLLAWTGEQPSQAWQWTVAFGGCFVLLLPATAAMGATLPAMAQVLAPWRPRAGGLGLLYAANTLGAMAGVLAAAFWLVPGLGLARSAAVCAGLGLVVALVAWRAFDQPRPAPDAAADTPPGRAPLPWRLALTGLLGIGHEVLVVRVLGQVTEATVYSFAWLLAVYLGGTALGAAAWQRWLVPDAGTAEARSRMLLLALAAAVLASGAALWGAPALKAAWLAAWGPGLAAAMTAEAVVALAAFALPTLAMGALFAQLAWQARGQGIGFARALGVNTLGAALAPALFGVLLLPLVGLKGVWLLVAGGYLLLAAAGGGAPRLGLAGGALAGGTLALAVLAPPLVIVDVPAGGRLLSHREGAMGAVSVIEDADGVARLHIDNHQQEGSSASRVADARQALLPLLLHPAPRQALFIGLGTGVTAYSAAQDPALRLDVVELVPEVIAASVHFTAELAAGLPPGRVQLHAADARRWVRSSRQRYDLVVADNFHPARSGTGSLYTVEHFAAVRDRLADGGLFCQWLPLHQLDLDSLRHIVRSFTAVYPDAVALLATHSLETPVLGLLARRGGTHFDAAAVRQRLSASGLQPAAFGLADEWALLGSVLATAPALARWAGDAAPNTDDHPLVAYAAPRITYAPEARPRDRLLALLAQWQADPARLLPGADAGQAARLAAYAQARNRYLAAGRDVQPSADARRMLAQVQEPLLAVLATSADFRPAYDPLLRLAQTLAAQDREAARALLAELARLQPARPEAAQALQRLAPATAAGAG